MAQRGKSYVASKVFVTSSGAKASDTASKKVAETPLKKNSTPAATAPKVITEKDLDLDTATAGPGDFKDRTDPKYVGPGTWNVIHQRAYAARTHEEQLDFIRYMKSTCYGFPCSICRGHCTKYIEDNPMEEYLDVPVELNGTREQLGMFLWAWKFHNAVNSRLRKPIMSWITAIQMFGPVASGVCSKNCTDAADEHETKPAESKPAESKPKPRNFTPMPAKPFKLVAARK